MSLSEEEMRFLEEHIPELATAAVKQAYWNALASETPVLICKDNALVEIHPDGTEKTIKQLPPPTPLPKRVIKGQKMSVL